MARIGVQTYKSENLTFTYVVNVDTQGNFTTTIPEEIAEKLSQVGIQLKVNRLYKKGYFTANTLQELKNIVSNVADKYSEKELIEDKIILRYGIDTSCHYCLGKDGTIYPDGSWQEKKEGDYNWVTGTKPGIDNNYAPFGFDFFVRPMKVKVWKFPNGEINKEYSQFNNNDGKDDDTLYWLNSIRKMYSDNSTIKEIDYTPEIGLFFKNLIIHVCELDKKIKKMFGEKVDLSKVNMDQLKQLGFHKE